MRTPGSHQTCIQRVAVCIASLTALAVLYWLFCEQRSVEGWSQGAGADETLSIAGAFMRALERRPTTSELASIKARLISDPTYSVGVLESQLALSPERQRRVATQTNALKTDLEGLFSRQQVRLHVRSVYADEIGTTPSPEAEAYLMRKFLSSGMDEHELIGLTKAIAIVPIAGNPSPLGLGRTE